MTAIKTKWLSVLMFVASGAALAATPETFTVYGLNITYMNAAAGYWSVNGAPRTTGTLFTQIIPSSTSISTDSSGKITGTGLLLITYNTAGVPFSQFAVSYDGQISAAAGAAATATLNIKGTGYTIDGTGTATSTVNTLALKFVGQPGANPLNTAQTKIVGSFTGTIRGQTPLGISSATLPALAGVITSSSQSFVSLSAGVAQNARKMVLVDTGFTGSGIPSDGAYRLNVSGTGPSKGAVFMVQGILGPHSTQVGTNALLFSAPITADMKGKLNGQVVSGSAILTQIDASLTVGH